MKIPFIEIVSGMFLIGSGSVYAGGSGEIKPICEYWADPQGVVYHGVPDAIAEMNRRIGKPLHSPDEIPPPSGSGENYLDTAKKPDRQAETYGFDPSKNGFSCSLVLGGQQGELAYINPEAPAH